MDAKKRKSIFLTIILITRLHSCTCNCNKINSQTYTFMTPDLVAMYDGEVSVPLTLDLSLDARFCDDTVSMSIIDYLTDRDPSRSVLKPTSYRRSKRVVPLIVAGAFVAAVAGVSIVGTIWNRISINDLQNQIDEMRAKDVELGKILSQHAQKADDYIAYVGVKLNETISNFDARTCAESFNVFKELLKIKMEMKVSALLNAIRAGEVGPELIPPNKIPELVNTIVGLRDSIYNTDPMLFYTYAKIYVDMSTVLTGGYIKAVAVIPYIKKYLTPAVMTFAFNVDKISNVVHAAGPTFIGMNVSRDLSECKYASNTYLCSELTASVPTYHHLNITDYYEYSGVIISLTSASVSYTDLAGITHSTNGPVICDSTNVGRVTISGFSWYTVPTTRLIKEVGLNDLVRTEDVKIKMYDNTLQPLKEWIYHEEHDNWHKTFFEMYSTYIYTLLGIVITIAILYISYRTGCLSAGCSAANARMQMRNVERAKNKRFTNYIDINALADDIAAIKQHIDLPGQPNIAGRMIPDVSSSSGTSNVITKWLLPPE